MDDRKRFLDSAENVRKLLVGFTILGFIALALDIVVHRPIGMAWERVWGVFGVFGFVGVALLILGARLLRKLVGRREDYYDVD